MEGQLDAHNSSAWLGSTDNKAGGHTISGLGTSGLIVCNIGITRARVSYFFFGPNALMKDALL